MPEESRAARPEPTRSPEQQLLLPLGESRVERPTTVKIYLEGFQITTSERGVLIETVDYHARPLFLDALALSELGLGLQVDRVLERVGAAKPEA